MKINGLEFAGVDIETTGSDIDAGAGICQIGVFLGDDSFVCDIKPHNGALVTEEALLVNGFTHERFAAGSDASLVDRNLYDWLIDHDVKGRTLIAIGWNVASFDLRFIKKFLPMSFSLFSYRTIDLNAVCFTMDPVNGVDKLKKKVKSYAAASITSDENWHDALYDAKAALFAWMSLRNIINFHYENLTNENLCF